MNIRFFSLMLVGGLCLAGQAIAKPVTSAEVQKAQGQMINRVSQAATQYARQIDIDQDYVSYCNGELYLKTYEHPENGYVPFGINYHDIKDSEQLDLILSSRETYEKSFLILCLANAKNALRDAARR